MCRQQKERERERWLTDRLAPFNCKQKPLVGNDLFPHSRRRRHNIFPENVLLLLALLLLLLLLLLAHNLRGHNYSFPLGINQSIKTEPPLSTTSYYWLSYFFSSPFVRQPLVASAAHANNKRIWLARWLGRHLEATRARAKNISWRP